MRIDNLVRDDDLPEPRKVEVIVYSRQSELIIVVNDTRGCRCRVVIRLDEPVHIGLIERDE